MSQPITNSVAQKLFNEFTQADMAYYLCGTPHATYLRRRAKHHLGQTRRELLRVAALGDDVKIWMTGFLEEFNH